MPLLHGDLTHIEGLAAGYSHWGRETVYDLIVPLIEEGDAPAAIRHAGEGEGAVRVALGEGDVVIVRIAEADIALREGKRVAATAAIQALIRSTALVHVRDHALDGVAAGVRSGCCLGRCAIRRKAVVDDLRIGEADGDVEAGWAKLLEVRRATNLDEGVVRLLTVERIGLEPLFAASDAVCTLDLPARRNGRASCWR